MVPGKVQRDCRWRYCIATGYVWITGVVCLEAVFDNSSGCLLGTGGACPNVGFCCWEVLWGGLLCWCYRAPDAGPLNSCFCVQSFGKPSELVVPCAGLCRSLFKCLSVSSWPSHFSVFPIIKQSSVIFRSRWFGCFVAFNFTFDFWLSLLLPLLC